MGMGDGEIYVPSDRELPGSFLQWTWIDLSHRITWEYVISIYIYIAHRKDVEKPGLQGV